MTGPDRAREAFWRQMEEVYPTSPIHRVLGLTLRVLGEGEVVVAYDGSGDAANRAGNAAGGAVAEMIDSAVVQACRTTLRPGDQAVTLELKVNYLRPGQPGVTLRTHGRIEHIGRSTVVGYARTERPDGKLVAIGVVTVNVKRA